MLDNIRSGSKLFQFYVKMQFFLISSIIWTNDFFWNDTQWANNCKKLDIIGHSSEIRSFCKICHILILYIRKPKDAFSIFHFVLLYFYSPHSFEANLNPTFFFFLLLSSSSSSSFFFFLRLFVEIKNFVFSKV